ncbi:glycoprotein-N-acetylgalactosamine 3-beta-galactosyltransferase 1-like isoform X2 [Littorina saxatilis]|uniref:glycoprotein-N-acetylgalactosamine 3-beta-galactosyltransferase 1-like isoform X2 n=1 Tax=Littorina saxatilis TaxID=31220 RepID=UPI0038B41CD5
MRSIRLRGVLLALAAFTLALASFSIYKNYSPAPFFPENGQTISSSQKMGHEGADQIIPVDESEVLRLRKKVRVFVWVMTSPKSKQRARAVNTTWATRADRDLLVYMSSEADPSLPAVGLSVKEGRNHLTAKTMQAFDYVYKHYFHKADYFMKADDDTYVIMENLRYFLSFFDTKEPFFTGRHFKPEVKQGFNSGGAGYVLSKEALARLAARPKDPPLCKEDGKGEDVEIARCLEKLEVRILNSTDSRGRSRFHTHEPVKHVIKGVSWMHNYDANVVRVAGDCTKCWLYTLLSVSNWRVSSTEAELNQSTAA